MDVWTGLSYKTPLSYSPLYPLLLLSLTSQRHSPECSKKIKDEYDYIIVGGGAAGSVVASRLSEVPCVNVLVLEAGPKPPLISEVPGFYLSLLGTNVDWKFWTVSQKYLAPGKGNKLLWHAGRMLGGSGSLNAMNYVRGNHKNYDDWAEQGAKGWSYKDVLPYFLKLEDNRNINKMDFGYHQTGGPITFERPCFQSKIKDAFHKASKELGYEFVDSNGAKQTGFYDYQMNVRNGQRCSSVKGYLVPAENRPNLDILLNATVTKVIIEDNQAKGVLFYNEGVFQTVKAKEEVIVSGGAVNTPKLLMLSGIGPRDELDKWNISVVADLPVGKNLQDHGASYYSFSIDPEFSILYDYDDFSVIEEYINFRSGPLTNAGIIGIAFLNSLNATPIDDFPNYQLYISEFVKEPKKASLTSDTEANRKNARPTDEARVFMTCTAQQLQPRSKGTVTLNSVDPFDPPVIDPHYLEDPKDLDDIVDGLKMCKKIVSTMAFQRLGAKPFDPLFPECEVFADSDEEYFKCFTKHKFLTSYHTAGTAKMGDSKDPLTVVDPELRDSSKSLIERRRRWQLIGEEDGRKGKVQQGSSNTILNIIGDGLNRNLNLQHKTEGKLMLNHIVNEMKETVVEFVKT